MEKCEDIICNRDKAWDSGNYALALVYQVMLYDIAEDKEATSSDLSWALREILESGTYRDDYVQVIISIFSYKDEQYRHVSPLSLDIIALIVAMFAEIINLEDNELENERLCEYLKGIITNFKNNGFEYIAFQIYSITHIFQYINLEYALKIYEEMEIPEDFSDELTLSDLYFFVGTQYNEYEHLRSEALRVMEKGYEIRVRLTGEDSIFSHLQKMFIMENHFLTEEYAIAGEYAQQLAYIKDAVDGCRAVIRCYANLTLANISISTLQDSTTIKTRLTCAQNEFDQIDCNETMYNHLHFQLHSLWSMFYECINNDTKQELHLRLAYIYIKENGIMNYNAILANNNLALFLYQNGNTSAAKELLKDALNIIEELSAGKSCAAAYVYNNISVVNDFALIDEISTYHQKHINNSSTHSLPNDLQSKLNNICKTIQCADKHQLQEIENILNRLREEFMNRKIHNHRVETAFIKANAMLFLALNKKDEARQVLYAHLHELSMKNETGNLYKDFLYMYHLITETLKKEELEEIVLKIVHMYKDIIKKVLIQYDEYCILNSMWQLETIPRLVLCLTYRKKIGITVEKLYEIIVNYKSAYTDCLKLKKKIRLVNPEKEEYFKEIDSINNELINIELNKLYRKKEYDCTRLNNQKRLLELKMIENTNIPDIDWKSYDEIISNIPDNAIILDYYLFPSISCLELELGTMLYANFLVWKDIDSKYKVKHLDYISVYETRREMLIMWSSIMAKEKNAELAPLLTTVSRHTLYKRLIKPIQQYINDDIQYVFVSPDFDLTRLPFQVLGNACGVFIGDKYTFIYTETVRDIKNPYSINFDDKNALVIGNAKFSIKSPDTNHLPVPLKELEVAPLPLSKIEASTVANKLGVSPALGENATKNILIDSNADLIHIATHGYFKTLPDEEEFSANPLKRSSLFFSGINDWIQTGEVHEEYGNGVLTAEEICGIEMKPPSLVVLSACLSALGETHLGSGIVGLRTGFMANNTRALLVNIWEVDDFASAVLMDNFYEYIRIMPIADALKRAQMYLKNVTIKELREAMWFDESRLRKVGWAADDVIKFSEQEDGVKPFSPVGFWGGYMVLE